MAASTISSKGQTTIPVEIQRRLNVKPGDKIQYFLEADGRVPLVPKGLSLRDFSDYYLAAINREKGCRTTLTLEGKTARSERLSLI